jgi:hypothetical protein
MSCQTYISPTVPIPAEGRGAYAQSAPVPPLDERPYTTGVRPLFYRGRKGAAARSGSTSVAGVVVVDILFFFRCAVMGVGRSR